MRGSSSPSGSDRNRRPNPVSTTTEPGDVLDAPADDRGLAAVGMRAQRGEHRLDPPRVHADDRLPFVGDEQRIDAEQLGGGADRSADRHRRLLEHDPDLATCRPSRGARWPGRRGSGPSSRGSTVRRPRAPAESARSAARHPIAARRGTRTGAAPPSPPCRGRPIVPVTISTSPATSAAVADHAVRHPHAAGVDDEADPLRRGASPWCRRRRSRSPLRRRPRRIDA